MITLKTTSFRKKPNCPSSAMLLSYHEFDLVSELDSQVTKHLDACDFCCAEMHLLVECPQAEDDFIIPVAIPAALRRLAEEVLGGSLLTEEMFSESCFEKARLTLTDA